MQIVDTRGRLFGRINLIDLGVLLFIALLIPLGYGAYVLFRTPPARLTAVAPASLAFTKGVEQRVQVTGQHLRPFLRAKLGTATASNYALLTPDSAEIRFADLAPGTYDVVLFDESQEVTRLPAALTILPPPIQIVGWFIGSSATDDRIVPGLKWGPADRPTAEVLDVEQTHEGRLATVRVTCQLSPDSQCLIGTVAVRPGTELNLTMSGKTDRTTFRVHDLRVDRDWLDVKVRLMGLPESLALPQPGQIDGRPDDTAPAPIMGVTTGAVLQSVGELRKNQGTFAITTTQPQSVVPDLTRYGVLTAVLPVDAKDADLMVPAEPSPMGLRYRDGLIRPGGIIHFETAMYRIEALILSVSKPGRPTRFPEQR